MAVNALTYIKNVGKSVTYNSFKVVKDMNPVLKDFAETNAEATTTVYKAIKDIKKNIKKMPDIIKESEYGKFGKSYLNNLMDDLKTGKFYNKEREEQYEANAANTFAGLDGDDDTFGDLDSLDFGNLDSDDEISSNDMMDIVGEKASTAVSTAMARSAEYIVESNIQTTRAMSKQMNAIYGGLNIGMSTINQNLSKVIEFSNEQTITHFENSRQFYEKTTALNEERNQLLRNINDNLIKIAEPPKQQEAKKDRYGRIVDSDGVLDIQNYLKAIKDNIMDKSGGLFDMLKMSMDTVGLQNMIASPLNFIIENMVNSVIPNILRESMDRFNKSIGGLFGNIMMNLQKKARDSEGEGGIWGFINDIFGIETSRRTSIDTSQYEKGKVPFDGITRKAIIEVIPTYLSKILSAITGKKEDRFDYNSGKFISINDLQKNYDNITKDNAKSAASELTSVVKNNKNKLKFRSEEQQKQFDKDWEEIVQYMYKNQMNFNTKDKKLSGETFQLKGGAASDLNVKLLQHLIETYGRTENMQYAHRLYKSTANQNEEIQRAQEQSTYNALYNNSKPGSSDSGVGIKSLIDSANSAIVDELVAIRKEISYIRTYGISIQGRKNTSSNNRKKITIPSFDNFEVSKINYKSSSDNNEDFSEDDNPYYTGDDLDEKKLPDEIAKIITEGKVEYDKKEAERREKELASEEESLDEDGKPKKKKRKTIFDRIRSFKKGSKELIGIPLKFVSAVIDKADQRLYDMIFGVKEDKDEENSFLGKLLEKLNHIFDDFSGFLHEKIIDPLSEKLTKDNMKEGARKFFKMFDIDIDETMQSMKDFFFDPADGLFSDFWGNYKKSLKSIFGWGKDAVKESAEWAGVAINPEKTESGKEKEKNNKKIDAKWKKVQELMSGNAAQTSDENKDKTDENKDEAKEAKENVDQQISEHAKGIKRVDKTGLAVISEGEMIVPPDMNPFNIAKRKRNEKKVKNNLKNGIDSIFEYGKGKGADTFEEGLTSEEEAELREIIAQENNDPKKIKERLFKNKQKLTEDDYKSKVLPYLERISKEAASASAVVYNRITSEFVGDEKDAEKFKANALDFMGEVKEYGPTMAAGATVGAGVSLLTGLIGGPLLGAAVGAGTGLLIKSDKVQEMLFGKLENGERQGSAILSKDMANNITKYFPDMAKGATVGSILSILPFVPGGPVAGAILGSAVGFAKNNQSIQEVLFGPESLLGSKEQFQNNVRRKLPKMGVGALAGLLAGPFGVTTNVMLGAALGFASDTNTFKDLILGKEEDGVRTGGLIGQIKEFLDKEVLDPLKRARDPIIEQFKIIGEHVKESLTNIFKTFIGEPIKALLDSTIGDPLKKFVKGTFNLLLKPIKFGASLPFRAIGAIGDNLRASHIKSGRAVNYMQSAEERNLFRESKGRIMGLGRKDQYRDIDASIENITNVEDLDQIRSGFQAIKDSKASIEDISKSSLRQIEKTMKSSPINKTIRNHALKLVKAGKYDKAQTYIKEANIDDQEKTKILEVVTKEASRLQLARDMKKDSKTTSKNLIDQMRGLGLNISDDMINKLSVGGKDLDTMIKMFSSEIDYRKEFKTDNLNGKKDGVSGDPSIDKLNENQQKRHEETTDLIKEAIKKLDNIKEKANPDNIDKYTDPKNLTNLSTAERLSDEISDIYDERGKIGGTIEVGKRTLKGGLKLAGRTGLGAAKIGGKIVGGTLKTASKVVGGAAELAGDTYNAVRHSKPGDYLLGDKNTNWGPNFVGRDGAEVIEEIKTGMKTTAGVVSAIALNQGVEVNEAKDKENTKSFLTKIKNKFKKSNKYNFQFVDGLPIKMIEDENGDLKPDPSDSETDKSLKIINEKEETQKGILANLTAMPNMINGFFKKLFGNDEEKEKKSFFERIWEFFTGDGNAGGVTLLSILKGLIPFAVTTLGLSGLFDNLATKITNGAFGKNGTNDKIYVDGKEVKVDENGNPVKDENGNYISTDGETLSGDSYLQKKGSLDTMSLSDRLKYNAVRNTVTGKGSIVGLAVAKSPIGKVGKAIANSKPGKFIGKMATTGIDAADLDNAYDLITDAVTKWKGVVKGIPMVSEYADKIDDLGLAIMELVEKYLPKASKSLTSITKTFSKLAWPILIATTVMDFTTGYQDASTILRIKADNVTIPQKIICGLVRTIKNFVPIIGTFIPDSIVTDLFINYVASWFGIDVSKIKEQQSLAQAELDAYNASLPEGEKLTWAEYNKKVKNNYTWTERIGNAASSFVTNVKDKGLGGAITSGLANTKVGKAVSGFATTAKEKVSSAANWVGEKANSAITATKEFIAPVAQAVKSVIDTGKDLGSFAINTAKDAIAEALTGQVIDSSDSLYIDENDPYSTHKSIIYNLTKIILWPLTNSIKTGRELWENGIKPFINSVSQVGSGVITTAKNVILKSWNGNFFDAMKDTSGNLYGDNEFLNNTSSIVNGVTKAVMAIPGLLAFSAGNIVKGFKNTINGIIQIGSGAKTTIESLLTKSWQGDFIGAFSDTSGNLSGDNEFLNNISKVVNTGTKFSMAIPALLSTAIGYVVRNFHNVVDGFRTVGNGVSDTVTSIFDNAFKGQFVGLGEYFDKSTNAETGNALIDGTSTVANFITKLSLAPAVLLTTSFNFVKNKATSFFTELSKAGEISAEDKMLLEKAKEGDVSPLSKEYWEVKSNYTGIAGGFNWLVSTMNKVFTLPTALISYLNPLEAIKDGVSWLAKKMGIDDSETRTKPTSAGSGTGNYVGRGTQDSDGTFVSQVDPKYKNQVFNTNNDTQVQTLGNTGCAPAAAAMAINASMGSNVESMDNAAKLALKYKVKDDGVSADYFGDQFARHGIGAKYIESKGSSGSAQIMKELMSSNKVVLMGQDSNNTSKATSPFGANPHYVVATGLSPDGKYIYINDPESSTPNIKYDANKILNSSSLGISAKVANGTKKVVGKLRKYIGKATYGPDTIQYKVWNALRGAGYNEIATAAAMGNIEVESGFNPSLIEKGSGVGFGLIQWSYGRRTALEQEASRRGVNPGDLGFQIEYLLKELEPNSGQWTKASAQYGLGSFSRSDWADGKELGTATKAFMCCFERPSYSSSINHIARRLEAASKYYQAFTGMTIDTSLDLSYSSGLPSTTTNETATQTQSKPMNAISEILSAFSGLAKAFGLSGGDSSSSITTTDYSGSTITGNPEETISTIDGNVSSNPEHAKLQKALVEKMYSVKGQLKYAQNNAKYPGSRNPDDGSGDCSSTVQWAYKNILGVDPGDWTGAQRENSNTFTVATNTKDESKLQLGDLLLKDGHVEMYAGNGQMIGHGSDNGPKVKPLDQSGKYNLVRRWVGFQASGSGLPAYSNALKYIENKNHDQSMPITFNTEDLEKNKSSVIEFNSKKVASGSKRFVGRATEIPATTSPEENVNNDLKSLVVQIVNLLLKVVTNTDNLNNIAKLLGEYLTAVSDTGKSSSTSPTSSTQKIDDNQKNNAILAKQNLINALQSTSPGSSNNNTKLLKLIEQTERIARQ